MIVMCPCCAIPVAKAKAGTVDALCSRCGYRYRIWTVFTQTSAVSSISTLDRSFVTELVGREDSAGQRTVVARPGHSGRIKALIGAIPVGLLAGALTLEAGDFATMVVALLAFGASYYLWSLGFVPNRSATREERALVAEYQGLLAKEHAMTESLLDAIVDEADKAARARQVTALVNKMRHLDEGLYAVRIKRLDELCSLLERQVVLDQQLIHGFEKAIAMIDIEFDTRAVSDGMSASAVLDIDTALADLAAMKESVKELERQLAAGEDVERLLGPGPWHSAGGLEDLPFVSPIALEHLLDTDADEIHADDEGLEPEASVEEPGSNQVAGTVRRSEDTRAAQAEGKAPVCGECGAPNLPTEWYCEKCGAELSAF
jgi:hypothetical protein